MVSTYAKAHFDSSNYNTNRPRYRASLADTIIAHHKCSAHAQTKLAIDVATGTGIFARQLQGKFDKVIATDVSSVMLEAARADSQNEGDGTIEFIQSPAEHMSFVEPNSVDLITCATGAHWFDINAFVAEAKRVLKPSGTLAIFGYPGFCHFVDYPQCDQIAKDFANSSDKLGPFWDKGREVIVDGYEAYMSALSNEFGHVERRVYPHKIGGGMQTVGDGPVVMEFGVSWRRLKAFYSTWSGISNYQKAYPDRPSILDATIDDMMAAAGSKDIDEELNTQWEEILVFARA